ncbi:hypothetical protein H4Q26_008561 [Puccinia striiformis f. sp. tritici PST-130]|nr:hypothetical protein H4Q26_008561 [Puccinia striiformis f. sp. tritici PST-130]
MSTTSGSFPSPNPQHAQPPAQDRAQRDGANGPSSFQGLAGTGAHCGVNLRAVEYEKPLPAPPPSWPCDRSTDVVDGAVPDAEWKPQSRCSIDRLPLPPSGCAHLYQIIPNPRTLIISASHHGSSALFDSHSPSRRISAPRVRSLEKIHPKSAANVSPIPRRGWFGLEWWRKLQSQRGSIIEDNHDSAFDEKEAALLKATPTDEALSRTNGIMLPMHLLDSKILKPLSSSGSSDNPALSFLNLIPNFGSSSSENPPAQPGRSLSLSNTFLILAHLENFRDFLQFIGLIGGFYGSTLDSGHTNISKLPIFNASSCKFHQMISPIGAFGIIPYYSSNGFLDFSASI